MRARPDQKACLHVSSIGPMYGIMLLSGSVAKFGLMWATLVFIAGPDRCKLSVLLKWPLKDAGSCRCSGAMGIFKSRRTDECICLHLLLNKTKTLGPDIGVQGLETQRNWKNLGFHLHFVFVLFFEGFRGIQNLQGVPKYSKDSHGQDWTDFTKPQKLICIVGELGNPA